MKIVVDIIADEGYLFDADTTANCVKIRRHYLGETAFEKTKTFLGTVMMLKERVFSDEEIADIFNSNSLLKMEDAPTTAAPLVLTGKQLTTRIYRY